jgi:hypothetical protein
MKILRQFLGEYGWQHFLFAENNPLRKKNDPELPNGHILPTYGEIVAEVVGP